MGPHYLYETVMKELKDGKTSGDRYEFNYALGIHTQAAVDDYTRSIGVMARFDDAKKWWFYRPEKTEKTCIVTACNRKFPSFDTAVANRNAYGFDVMVLPDGFDRADYCWSKFNCIRETLRKRDHYDWMIWIDADAIITDLSRPQSHLVNGSPYDLIIPNDPIGGLNAGIFAVRVSKMEEIFLAWENQRNDNESTYDTAALYRLKCNMEVVNHRLCNSLPEYGLWGTTDWIAHFPGSRTVRESCSNLWSLTNARKYGRIY